MDGDPDPYQMYYVGQSRQFLVREAVEQQNILYRLLSRRLSTHGKLMVHASTCYLPRKYRLVRRSKAYAFVVNISFQVGLLRENWYIKKELGNHAKVLENNYFLNQALRLREYFPLQSKQISKFCMPR